MKTKHYLLLLILFVSIFSGFSQTGTPFKLRTPGTKGLGIKVKGNIKLIGNTMLGHTNSNPIFDASGNVTNLATLTTQANGPTANGATGQNDLENMEYIDIDADGTTFSSSSADLAISSKDVGGCKRVIYAGLYWAATYPYERSTDVNSQWNSFPANTPRIGGFNQIKFKRPGDAAYANITADQIIFDGYNSGSVSSSFSGAPYVCYKDVTTSLQQLADANGTYTLANVRAARGKRLDGSSAGWTLVIIYESPNVPPRHFAVYDGLERITGSHDLPLAINGFTTSKVGKVVANIGVAALDGDREKFNDRYQFSSGGPFIDIKDSFNDANNFFDSSLTDNNAIVNAINPIKKNTYGFDLDQVELPNPGNSVLAQGSTSSTIRMTTLGNTEDTFMPFIATFAVDDYIPDVVLTKTVNNLAGTNIDGQLIPSCTDFKYIIGFQNLGSDNAIGVVDPNFVVITDILPSNVTFVSIDTSSIPGTTYIYDPILRKLTISVPKGYFEVGDPRYTFTIYVKTACKCEDISDACSTSVKNQAFITYVGESGGQVITSDPSSSVFDATCNVGNASPANSTILPTCKFESDVYICGTTTPLTGPAGYDTYLWTGPAGATYLPNNTSQVVTVNMIGDYTVVGTKVGCAPITYVYHVKLFSSAISNPVLPYDEATPDRFCANTNVQMPYIYLCGAADHLLIQTGITDAQSITWQVYNPSATCLTFSPLDCPNATNTCWSNVATGPDYDVINEGNYRIVLTYPGCSKTFYFNVLKNNLDFTIVKEDIFCNTPGKITINGVPAFGYSFSLLNSVGTVITGPQASNIFVINAPGVYGVKIEQTSISGGCIFYNQVPIDILKRVATTQVGVIQPVCYGDPASITLSINGVRPQYFFNLFNSLGALVASSGAQVSNTYTFNALAQGQTYTWTTNTSDGCTDTGTVTINNPLEIKVNLTLIKNITCTNGAVQVDVTGGVAPYFIYVSPNTGPPQPYLSGNTFPVSTPGGTYTVNILDSNNCKGTAQIIVTPIPASTITPIETDIKCFADGNVGTINFQPVLNGNTMLFAISTVSAAGPFTYVTQSVFNNLAPGTYYCSATYTYNGDTCTIPTVTLVIDRNPEIIPTLVIKTDLTCTAGTNTPGTAVITADATGGVPVIQASIDGVTFFPVPHDFTVNGSGVYTVTYMDAVGCKVTKTIPILPLTPPTTMSFLVSPLQCNVTSTTGNVTVTVTAVGGTAPLSYQIIAPSVGIAQSSNVFAGLNPGITYTFQVTDARGCSIKQDLVIPALPIVTVSLTSPKACFGSATSSITVTVTGTANFQYAIGAGPKLPFPGSNPFVILGQPVGVPITITVYDFATQCSGSSTITIPIPVAAITGTLNVTPIKCVPNFGSVEVLNAANGWGGPYQYELLQPNLTVLGPQSSNVFTPLSQIGNYVVTIIDSNGCRQALAPFALTAPSIPVLSIQSQDLCVDANGTSVIVQVNAGTGTAPFQFSLDGGAFVPANIPTNAHQYINLSTGGLGHVITVKDAFGCTNNITLSVINPQLTATATITKTLDCSTASPNATIHVDIVGGYPAYTYEVSFNGGAYGPIIPVVGASFNYSAALAGTYAFRITDTRACSYIVTAPTISALIPLNPTFTQTNNKCFGDTNGSFTIIPAGGQAPYVVSVNGSPFTSQTTYSGLGAGTYNVIVRDANQCLFPLTIVITAPTDIIWTHTTNSISCGPGGNVLGSIVINTLSGGTAPAYTLTLIDLSGLNPNVVVSPATAPYTFGGLNFGNYQVTVTDANGCSKFFTTTVASPVSSLTIDVSAVPGNCAIGACIKLTAGGGVGPYFFAQYPVNPLVPSSYDYATYFALYQPEAPLGSGQSTFCGLVSGVTYSFIVYDQGSNCYYFRQATSPTTVFSPITVAATPKNVTCKGSADGSVSFTISNYGGTSVSYQIFNGVTNTAVAPTLVPVVLTGLLGTPVTISNIGPLPVGSYYVVVRELNGPFVGCSNATPVFTITESPTLLSVTAKILKNANCNASGTIQIDAVGGTAPYLYYVVLSPGAAPAIGSPLWLSSNIVTLPANATPYNVYVLDAFGCIKSTQITMISDPVPSVSAVVKASSVCNAQGAFAIDVMINSAGIEPYTYSIDGGAFQNLVAAYPLTYPYPFTIGGLSSGNHTIELVDKNGCGVIGATKLNVTINPPLSINASFTTLPTCNSTSGTITANASGGSGVTANYQYTLYDSTGLIVLVGPQTSSAFINQAPGTYWVQVRDITTNCTARVQVSLVAAIAVNYDLTASNVSCFGSLDGTITVSNVVGDAPFTYQIIAPIVFPAIPQASNVFTGLGANTYTVAVTSVRGCTLVPNKTIEIKQPAALALNAPTVSSPSCNNNAIQPVTVTVNVTPGTGTAPYLYSFNGGAYTSNNVYTVFATLVSQTINYAVKDANGCPINGSVPVPAYIPLTATATTAAVTCAPTPLTGNYTIIPSGGSGGGLIANYTYSLVAGNPVVQHVAPNQNVFDISQPGSYYFRVTDSNGCWYDLPRYDVPAFDIITVSAPATTSVICFNTASGSIGPVVINNYVGPYNYVLQGSVPLISGSGNTSVSLVIGSVPVGSYTLLITETNTPFCDATVPVTILGPPAGLTASIKADALVNCNNTGGVITVNQVSGGWGGYQFELVRLPATIVVAYGSASSFSNLPGGTYVVNVKDSKGCIVPTNQVTLTTPVQITAASVTPSTLACLNDSNGTITVSGVTGGVGPYQYILITYDSTGLVVVSTSAPQASNIFQNLPAGNYGIQVIDGFAGCGSPIYKIAIANPTQVKAALTKGTNTQDCATSADTIILTASGGTGPYTYATSAAGPFIPMASNPISFVLLPATYTYYVKDFKGCISLPATVDIVKLQPLSVTVKPESNLSIICFGDATGSLFLSAQGGLGNLPPNSYNYNVTCSLPLYNVSNTTGIFQNLPAGIYTINVTNGTCFKTITQEIKNANPALNATVTATAVTCRGEKTGSINIKVVSNGVKLIVQYQVDKTPDLENVGTGTILDPFNPLGFTIPELPAGSYTITLTDGNGCQTPFTVIITEPATAVTALVATTNETCSESNNGTIAFTAIGGGNGGDYVVGYALLPTPTVPNPLPIQQFTVPTGNTTYTITGVDPSVAKDGVFVAFVLDSKKCKITFPIKILAGSTYEPVADVNIVCKNNVPVITVTVKNSKTVSPDPFPTGFKFSLDVDNEALAQTSNVFVFNNPGAAFVGTHRIYVYSPTNCDKVTQDFIIDLSDVNSLSLSLSYQMLNQIVADVTGGIAPYNFTFDDPLDGYSAHDNGSNPVYVYDHSGTYEVTVTDSRGCYAVRTKSVIFIPIKIINVYTPGDGGGWSPLNTSNYPNLVTRIYDRYGRMIAELPEGQKWYGKYNGQELPSGDYWYVIKVDESNAEEFVGHFTLYR